MTEPHSNPWADVSPYLDEALELDPHERESWLATLAATAPLLAGELRELLALHAANRASGFMERSSLRGEESLAGEQIGPYTIERLLGRGGMGSVWLARRSDGQFEGSVAIKLLDRRGLGRDAAEQIRHEASLAHHAPCVCGIITPHRCVPSAWGQRGSLSYREAPVRGRSGTAATADVTSQSLHPRTSLLLGLMRRFHP